MWETETTKTKYQNQFFKRKTAVIDAGKDAEEDC